MSFFEWFKQISAALEPWVIGGLGIYIAYSQWQSSRRQAEIAGNRLKYDLFQKRYAVYRAVVDFFISINIHGTMKSEDLNKYYLSIHEARWVLNEEIYLFLTKDVVTNARKLRMVDIKLSRIQSPSGSHSQEELNKVLDKQEEIFNWFHGQMDDLDKKFEPFLLLKH